LSWWDDLFTLKLTAFGFSFWNLCSLKMNLVNVTGAAPVNNETNINALTFEKADPVYVNQKGDIFENGILINPNQFKYE